VISGKEERESLVSNAIDSRSFQFGYVGGEVQIIHPFIDSTLSWSRVCHSGSQQAKSFLNGSHPSRYHESTRLGGCHARSLKACLRRKRRKSAEGFTDKRCAPDLIQRNGKEIDGCEWSGGPFINSQALDVLLKRSLR
jgi:hypothetical protein